MGKWIGCLLLPLCLCRTGSADDSIATIRAAVQEVQLTVVATDRSGRPVSNLSPGELSVSEDGRPVQHFDLRSASDLPLRVGVVLDLSQSMEKSWPAVRSALIDSLQQILRPEDQVVVLGFDNKIELERVLTPSQKLDLAQIPKGGGLTALYDTLYVACRNGIFAELRQPRRSALIVFSDGEDNLSRHGLDDAIESAQSAGIAVYSVSTHSPRRRSQGDPVLRELARATGGRNFVTANSAEVRTAMMTINDELRTSYLLYFRSSGATGRHTFRHVDLAPTHNDGTSFRSRAGYYAVP